MDVRVELAVRLDLDEALAGERLHELTVDESDTFLQLGLLVLGGSLERALEIVEDADYEVIDEEAKQS